MLTGFNTDIEYDGVVYHVQTEDKGLRTPFILSLVYTGGAILASKRSPYDDLISRGFDEGVLAQRLSRQHKLICAAVHAGRIEDLKRLSERDQAEKTMRGQQSAPQTPTQEATDGAQTNKANGGNEEAERKGVSAAPDQFSISERAEDQELKLILLDEEELRAGKSVTLRVLVGRAGGNRREPARQARIVVKILGTNFRPTSISSTTNTEGIASIPVLLPSFETGRAAILVQADIDGETAELRRIILPAKPS
ncbi:MAG TPA: hypothetical protein VF333_06545 [Pyrinomonadaceae bacterium]